MTLVKKHEDKQGVLHQPGLVRTVTDSDSQIPSQSLEFKFWV